MLLYHATGCLSFTSRNAVGYCRTLWKAAYGKLAELTVVHSAKCAQAFLGSGPIKSLTEHAIGCFNGDVRRGCHE